MKLWEWKERGGGGNTFFILHGGTINSHISRFQAAPIRGAPQHARAHTST